MSAAQSLIHELQDPKAPQATGLFSGCTRGFPGISTDQHRILLFCGLRSLCQTHSLITRTNCESIRKRTEVTTYSGPLTGLAFGKVAETWVEH